jgi:transcriptional regulator with XRE-family HTH domain
MTGGLGLMIKVKRILKGLSQEDLAKRVGLSQSALSRIEQQRSDPKFSHVVKILKELGIEPNKILVENSKELEDLFQ